MRNTRLRPRLAALVSALALTGAAGGCGGASGASSDDPWSDLTFTIGEQSSGIVPLVEASGVFDDAPYEIKWAKFDYGPPLVAALSTGDIDLGSVGAVPPITGAAADLDFKIIAIQEPYDPQQAGENIIVPEGSELRSLKDLEGKRISVPQGSSAHGLVLNALRSVGLGPDDVELVYLDPKAGASAFSSGKVDAWAIWEPQSSLALQQGGRVLAAGLPPLDSNNAFYVGSAASLEDPERREALTDVLERLARAYEYGNDHDDAHVEALIQDTGLDEAAVRKNLDGWRYHVEHVDADDVKSLQTLADNFHRAGEITKEVDAASVVDNLLPDGFEETS